MTNMVIHAIKYKNNQLKLFHEATVHGLRAPGFGEEWAIMFSYVHVMHDWLVQYCKWAFLWGTFPCKGGTRGTSVGSQFRFPRTVWRKLGSLDPPWIGLSPSRYRVTYCTLQETPPIFCSFDWCPNPWFWYPFRDPLPRSSDSSNSTFSYPQGSSLTRSPRGFRVLRSSCERNLERLA